MPYLGTPPQSGFITSDAEKITGQTTNYVNLSNAISSLDDVQVHVNYVIQDPSTLTFTSTTRIGLGDTLVSSDVVLITYLGKSVATQSPPVGGVSNDMLAGSIANSKLSNSSITLNGSAVSLGGSATVGGTNTPAFQAYLSSNQSIPSQTSTKINIDTEVFDTDNKFTSNKFTPTVVGKYFLYGSTQTTSSEDFDDYIVAIYKNGSEIARTRVRHHYAECIKVVTTAVSDTDDYFELYSYVGSSSAKTIFGNSAGTYFGGYKLIE